MKQSVSIIGFGRFGKTLYRMIKDDFDVTIYDLNAKSFENQINIKIAASLQDVYANDVIFLAVPIQSFESVIKDHKKYFEDRHLLIDVLSVKLHPAKVLTKQLAGSQTQAILTHPMYGPDSSKNGFDNLPFIIDKFKANETNYDNWKKYFISKKLNVIEMTPDQHDKITAGSLGLAQFLGRVLEAFDLKKSSIDSLGTTRLQEVEQQTINDTWELFTGLQQYNPHTKEMRFELGEAYDKLYNTLLAKQIEPGYLTIGIQGGKGSFNEEAVINYLRRENIAKYRIKYLHTSEAVMNALYMGEVDRGQLATHNSIGGIVSESIEAMAKYKFKIVEDFTIKISHALMIRKDVNLADVKIIMSHPQVFIQCKDNLASKYPNLELKSGEGKLIDHAMVAKLLHAGKLPKETAVMGSKVLAELYNLRIVEDNLQDRHKNDTSFLQVERT
jgi:prephenate dehydrogenase